jgi:hypothetical protein
MNKHDCINDNVIIIYLHRNFDSYFVFLHSIIFENYNKNTKIIKKNNTK